MRTGATFNSFKLTTSDIGVENGTDSSSFRNDVFANSDVNIVNVFVPESGPTANEAITDEFISEEIPIESEIESEEPEIESEELIDPIEFSPSVSSIETGEVTQQIS